MKLNIGSHEYKTEPRILTWQPKERKQSEVLQHNSHEENTKEASAKHVPITEGEICSYITEHLHFLSAQCLALSATSYCGLSGHRIWTKTDKRCQKLSSDTNMQGGGVRSKTKWFSGSVKAEGEDGCYHDASVQLPGRSASIGDLRLQTGKARRSFMN